MLIDLNKPFFNLDGSEANLGTNNTLAKKLAEVLAFTVHQTGSNGLPLPQIFSAVRTYEMAKSFDNEGVCDIDSDGIKKLKDYVEKSQLFPVLKAQIILEIDAQASKKSN